MEKSRKTKSRIIPEATHPKFFAQHLFPYELVKRSAKNKKILEVGFGDGYGAAYLSDVAQDLSAIDHDEENVKAARLKYKNKNLEFYQMGADALKFEDNKFDIACSFQVIEHLDEETLSRYLREVSRVLKPNSPFYLSTLNKENNIKPGQPYEKNIEHVKEFDSKSLRSTLSTVFPRIDLYGLKPTAKHLFYQRLKKIGLFNAFPGIINPVSRFYNNITTKDFELSAKDLRNSLDFICICTNG